MKRILKKTAVVAAAVVAASPAFAHTGAGHADGFMAGLAHPVLGADHLLAMLSVGVWSGLAGRRHALAAPLAFVVFMLAGAALSLSGIALPAVEGMVAASVLALGLMVVAGGRLPIMAGAAMAGLFALFHGHAHAGEATGHIGLYIAGFSLSTLVIHVAGMGLGKGLARSLAARLAVGGAVSVAGGLLLAGL